MHSPIPRSSTPTIFDRLQYATRGVHRTHAARGTSSADIIDVTSLPMCIEQVLLRIATVFVYGHMEGVGVTAYPVIP